MVSMQTINPEDLGNADFRSRFGVRYAYYAGAMYQGIASAELVIAMGRAGMMGFLGTGGMRREKVVAELDAIQAALAPNQAYGANLLNNLAQPEIEEDLVDLYLQRGVKIVEASAYMTLSPAIVRYRAKGLKRDANGRIVAPNRIIAKLSRPEVARAFLNPPPDRILRKLVEMGRLSQQEAELAKSLPVAEAICVEADSGGHTDQGSFLALLPSIQALQQRISAERNYQTMPFVGAAGGLGSPQAIAAAFMMGADFVCLGSVNQCTVEARTSDAVKDLLQQIDIQDTDYAPSGDMFEIGAKTQVLKKGLFFPARANKLFDIYMHYETLDELKPELKRELEDKYFQRSIEEVWEETRLHYASKMPELLARAERSPKVKMGMILRWYFVRTTRLALSGDADGRTDYQVHCGPALGSFNQIVKGTEREDWRRRHVAELGEFLMRGAAEHVSRFYDQTFARSVAARSHDNVKSL